MKDVMTPLEPMMAAIRALPVEDRKRLISLIVDTLTEPPTLTESARSLLDYEGVGAELWAGADAQAYVSKLRDEWDERA